MIFVGQCVGKAAIQGNTEVISRRRRVTDAAAPSKWSKSTARFCDDLAGAEPAGLVAAVVPVWLLVRRIIIDWHDASAVEKGRIDRADAPVGGRVFSPDR
jgi:hypothetical protein